MTEPMLLRPLGLMEIAVHSFRIYFRNLPILVALAMLLFGPSLILFALGIMWLNMGLGVQAVFFIILGVLAYLAAIFYFYAAATLVVSLHLVGQKAGVTQILQGLRGAIAIQLLGTGVLQTLAILGGLILLIIPGIIFLIRYMFAQPIVILERTAYGRAMRRSRDLVSGYWWRLFGAFLLVLVIIIVAQLITGFILSFPFVALGLRWEAAWNLGYSIAQLVMGPLGVIYPVLLYYDIRVRKEALNIETIRETI